MRARPERTAPPVTPHPRGSPQPSSIPSRSRMERTLLWHAQPVIRAPLRPIPVLDVMSTHLATPQLTTMK